MRSTRAFMLCAAIAGGAFAQPLLNGQDQAPALQAHPALYSFADIYRMTVRAGEPAAPERLLQQRAPSETLRVSVSPAQAAPELRVRTAPAAPGGREPQGWVLFVTGLVLAGWVAHRRIVNWL